MKMVFYLFSAFITWTCASPTHISQINLVGYDFSSPDKKIILPEILHEVSGVTVLDSTSVLCVQDEKGILFQYDVVAGTLVREYPFEMDGDYEGITCAGHTVFVLRSDGVLFEIPDYTDASTGVNQYETHIPSGNNEGLCYDHVHNRLLVACKNKLGKGPEFKDKRAIYSFDLTTHQLSEEPEYLFDLADIRAFAIQQKIDLPVREKKKGEIIEPIIRFRPSAIMIHPITGKLYLLSAVDHMLFVFNEQGKVEHLELLDERTFNKSEGITFFSNGDALITNEGQEGKPTLLRFSYKPVN